MLQVRWLTSCLAVFGAATLAAFASAQAAPPPQGVNRDQMWPAPTAEDWKKPCLVHWQRTFDDALAVSKETGRPMLVCINMDGEPASEHYAGVRYRQPEIAALYEPYICVIASVYRHNPRDFDEHGERILCPRFGSVTCGEHIAIESILYAKYMDGRRVAPRHLGVELNGEKTFDVYYAWDTDTIFNALKQGIVDHGGVPPLIARGDRPIEERVESHDNEDRTAVELAFAKGDKVLRRELLTKAVAHAGEAPIGLLRLAIEGPDEDLAAMARGALAQTSDEGSIDLLVRTLSNAFDAQERDSLIAALERLGAKSTRARDLATVYHGMTQRSTALDGDAWANAIAAAKAPATPTREAIEEGVDRGHAALRARPNDSAAALDVADATVQYAMDVDRLKSATDLDLSRRYAPLLFEDAERAARKAETLGARGWRVDADLAVASYALGRREEAYARAESALKSGLPRDATDGLSAYVLALFAESREHAIDQALRAKKEWPPQWLSDANAAYALLARHPCGSDLNIASYFDLMWKLGVFGQAARVLDQGIARFPDSAALHARLRTRMLADRGPLALEAYYDAKLSAADAPKDLHWYAGYASLVVAEYHQQQHEPDAAEAAYTRAAAHYEASIEKDESTRQSSDHYVAMALAGRARMALERGDWKVASRTMLASFARDPHAAGTLDGLSRSPVATARLIVARLDEHGLADDAAALRKAIDGLDPEALRPPPFELEEGAPPYPQSGGRVRGPNRGK